MSEVKLWLLRPIEDLPNSPWEPWYDKAFGFVVRAETEQSAREFAQQESGDESEPDWGTPGPKTGFKTTPWQDPAMSTCIELTAEGEAGIVLRDFAAA